MFRWTFWFRTLADRLLELGDDIGALVGCKADGTIAVWSLLSSRLAGSLLFWTVLSGDLFGRGGIAHHFLCHHGHFWGDHSCESQRKISQDTLPFRLVCLCRGLTNIQLDVLDPDPR